MKITHTSFTPFFVPNLCCFLLSERPMEKMTFQPLSSYDSPVVLELHNFGWNKSSSDMLSISFLFVPQKKVKQVLNNNRPSKSFSRLSEVFQFRLGSALKVLLWKQKYCNPLKSIHRNIILGLQWVTVFSLLGSWLWWGTKYSIAGKIQHGAGCCCSQG